MMMYDVYVLRSHLSSAVYILFLFGYSNATISNININLFQEGDNIPDGRLESWWWLILPLQSNQLVETIS